MTRNREHDDRGFILPATIAAITLMAIAALLTGRVVGVLLRASMQESFAVEEHAVTETVTGIIDAWMADPQVSTLLVSDPADPRVADVWRTRLGEPCIWGEHPTCWKIDSTTRVTYSGTLRGGEAERHAQDVTATVAVGCWGSTPEQCQRTRTFTRRYERAVFSQYQLHYDTNAVPSTALDGPNGLPDDLAACDDPNIPPDPVLCDDLDPATVIVFTGDDTLNGPLRTTLTEVLHCGSPTFNRVEVGGNAPSPPTSPLIDVGCSRSPQWNPAVTLPNIETLISEGRVVYGGDLDLPPLAAFSLPSDEVCALDRIHYTHHRGTSDPTAVGLRAGNCPGEAGQATHAVIDGDIIQAQTNDIIIIEHLILEGSVTIYAEGDIIVCGDIETRGTNPAGGPNVIALITEGDVILDPNGLTPPACGDDTLLELHTSHNLTLTNVAVLAPDGAVYARRWHLPHASTGGPTLTIEGSIAAKYLGLYAIPDQTTGTITSGWAKTFTYPADFWQARPPWWPGQDGSEWAPVATPESASDDTTPGPLPPEPEPGITVSRAAVTVTEGATATELFTVVLDAQPLANVTVRLDSLIFFTNRLTLSFTPADWDTPQIVVVDASTYTDTNPDDNTFIVNLTASGGGYDNVASHVAVTVAEPLAPSLVVSPDSLDINEGGSDTFTVSLATAPSASVTVTVESDDTSKATVMPATLTFTTGDWADEQPVTVIGVPDATTDNEIVTVTLTASGGSYNGATVTIAVTITDEPSSSFDAGDATAYVAVRDCLLSEVEHSTWLYNNDENQYRRTYQAGVNHCRSQRSLDADIPLGEDDPNSLPDPADQQALKDAIDALAVAAGLSQAMIDAAEGG